MNKKVINVLSGQHNASKIGLIISSIIITGALLPNVQTNWLTFDSKNSLTILFLGCSMFFFFMGIKVNQMESIVERGGIIIRKTTLPKSYTSISKFCFLISLILFIIFLKTFL